MVLSVNPRLSIKSGTRLEAMRGFVVVKANNMINDDD